MRLQLTLAPLVPGLFVLALGCHRSPVTPGTRGEVSLHAGYYADRDHVEVWSPSLRARVPLTDRVTASAGYGLDVVSAASVDVVASASRFLERRFEATAGLAVAVDPHNSVQATFRDSRESDYISDGATVSVDHASDRRDRLVHLELRGRHDLAGPGFVLRTAAPLTVGSAAASLTQILDPFTVLRVAVSADVLYGYQSSVYRFVSIGEGAFAERVPEMRVRPAILARLQRSVERTVAVYVEYAGSADNWGVVANSCDLGFRWQLTPWLLLDARNRFGAQTAAFFYQGSYDQLTAYRTRDRLLGGLIAWWPRASLQVNIPAWPATDDWEFGLAGGYLSQRFFDFAPMTQREALLLEAWLTRRF